MNSGLSFLGNEFVSHNGKIDDSSVKSAQLVGIYFSAHWCPPCRNFTPILAEFYKEVNKNGKKLEIVFASSDSDEKGFKEYFESMPWIAFPFGGDKKEEMSDKFGVSGIPMLVILNQEGQTISTNARGEVTSLKEKAWDTWVSKVVEPYEEVDPSVWENIKKGIPVKAK